MIDPEGAPVRVGFALGNEFSDHVTERQNYLYLAHSKLRPSSFGPELLVGDLPADMQRRLAHPARQRGAVGEAVPVGRTEHVAHDRQSRGASLQIWLFRRPGDVHVHYFGTATLSFSDGIKTEKGDVFEIEAEPFGLPLRNRLWTSKAEKVKVRAL